MSQLLNLMVDIVSVAAQNLSAGWIGAEFIQQLLKFEHCPVAMRRKPLAKLLECRKYLFFLFECLLPALKSQRTQSKSFGDGLLTVSLVAGAFIEEAL